MMQLLHPLFATFFARLGFEPVLADQVCPAGIEKRQAPFCFPAEQSHGWLAERNAAEAGNQSEPAARAW